MWSAPRKGGLRIHTRMDGEIYCWATNSMILTAGGCRSYACDTRRVFRGGSVRCCWGCGECCLAEAGAVAVVDDAVAVDGLNVPDVALHAFVGADDLVVPMVLASGFERCSRLSRWR